MTATDISQKKSYLLLFSVGPVQEFIAQARRSRDLWFGSHILSEISKYAAKEIHSQYAGSLIFPAIDASNIADLDYCDSVQDLNKKRPLNVANKIFALIENVTQQDLDHLVKETTRKTNDHWIKIANKIVRNDPSKKALIEGGLDPVIDQQINAFLEFFTVALPIGNPNDKEEYKKTRSKLEKMLGARKNLREFNQWEHHREGAPKSTLDGARDSILKDRLGQEKNAAQIDNLRQRYKIPATEQLDAVSFTKRLGGEPDHFLPIANVAMAARMDAWGEGKVKEIRDVLDVLPKELKEMITNGADKRFPFDAQIFYPNRWRDFFFGREFLEKHDQDLKNLEKNVEKWLNGKEANPYVACLVADGDKMGEVIDELSSPDAHRKLSKKLSQFARTDVNQIIKEHKGSLIYAGGDDVIAFLPIENALACADALRICFAERIHNALAEIDPETARSISIKPTLSVGIGIGHFMDGMGYILNLGRAAEKQAKGSELFHKKDQRNAVAIIFDKRSGGQLTWRCQWESPIDAKTQYPQYKGAMQEYAAAQKLIASGAISNKKIYEIQEMADQLKVSKKMLRDHTKREEVLPVLHYSIKHILGRNMLGMGGTVQDIESFMDSQHAENPYEFLNDRCNLLRIALELHNKAN